MPESTLSHRGPTAADPPTRDDPANQSTARSPPMTRSTRSLSLATIPPILALDFSDIPQDPEATYPEGGYGWVVTGAACILLFQHLGILYAWGVIQAELSRTGLSSSLQLSLVGATGAFFLGLCCLPAAWVLDKLGPRITVAIGVLGAGLCLILSGSSISNLPGLIFLHGFGFGTFGSLIYLTACIMPSRYFLKKRGFSTGIASYGAGVGGAIWSVAIERMISAWGLAWTYRFLGLSTILVGGHNPSGSLLRKRALYTALFNIASGIGRIAFGLFADKAVGNINSWLCSLLFIVLSSLLIWANAASEALIILFVIVCGAGSGGFFSLQTSVVAQIVGDNRLQTGIAWLEIAESFGYFAGPVSAGALLDALGGTEKGAGPYRPAIFLVGGTTALALALIASVRYSTSKKLWKRV